MPDFKSKQYSQNGGKSPNLIWIDINVAEVMDNCSVSLKQVTRLLVMLSVAEYENNGSVYYLFI